MPNVDDRCCDFQMEWIRRLWEVSVDKMEDDYEVTYSFDDIPKEITYSWLEKFWDFDISTWKPKTDNRAFPGTFYGKRFYDIFEFNSYEIVEDMLKYIQKTCKKITKKKRNVIDDLMVDVQIVPQDLKIPALEIAMQQTKERIDKLEKLLNERMDELELFISANLTKHEDLINELTHKSNDIQEVLNNHKEALIKINETP